MLNSTQDQVEVEVEVRVELGKSKVRYKYLELIWYLKDTKKIPVFTWKRYLLDTEVGLKRY